MKKKQAQLTQEKFYKISEQEGLEKQTKKDSAPASVYTHRPEAWATPILEPTSNPLNNPSQKMNVLCQYCGSVNELDSEFCGSCGAERT